MGQTLLKTKRYWKIRKILLNWIFKLKKIRFTLESRRQSLSSFFVEKNMYYEACIMLTRFYEYESKLSNFFKFANQVEKNLNKYHLDSADKWDGSRLAGVEEKFLECKKELPEMLLKCSSAFAIKNWDRM